MGFDCFETQEYQYIIESRISYTIYYSRTADPIWLKIDRELA